jgi:hypothetical protein
MLALISLEHPNKADGMRLEEATLCNIVVVTTSAK